MAGRKPGTVRIIAGRWRGTRLPIPDLPGLRPSGDRARETLFSWLQPHLRGSRCADLFAGSGSLGLEAASRGAARVVLVENERAAARSLAETLHRLSADNVTLIPSDALTWLRSCAPGSLDIVFVDPPFGSGLAERALALIAQGGVLDAGGLVYLESARESAPCAAGPAWKVKKEKAVGDVRMQLLEPIRPA